MSKKSVSDTKQSKTDEPNGLVKFVCAVGEKVRDNIVDALCNAVNDTARETIKSKLKEKPKEPEPAPEPEPEMEIDQDESFISRTNQGNSSKTSAMQRVWFRKD